MIGTNNAVAWMTSRSKAALNHDVGFLGALIGGQWTLPESGAVLSRLG